MSAALAVVAAAPAGAVTVSSSGVAPTVDQGDIANLAVYSGGNLIWTDRDTQGQTFTTGGDWSLLNAVTIQLGATLGWKDYLFRFGTVDGISGNTFNPTTSETVRFDPDFVADDYLTFTFDSPVLLQPNTVYGFDVGVAASQDGWQSGIPSVRTTGDLYLGGRGFDAGRPSNPGTALSLHNNDKVFHADIDDAPGSGFLTLRVDTTSGAMTLVGGSFVPIDLNYFQVASPGNSLDPAGWSSMADQDLDGNGAPDGSGNGWEEAGGNGAHSLAEGYLLGTSSIGVDAELAMGAGYDAGVDARDLVFTYRTGAGDIFEGDIQYVSSAIPGDTDGDGDIDDSDLGTAFANYTGPIGAAGGKTAAEGDTDGDGDVDDSDLGTAFAGYTGPLTPASVPEPSSLAWFVLGALGLARRRA
ncbi:MAG: PEP-CTERM sorting domain-containing protein [Phycisphaeraceae bacterium]